MRDWMREKQLAFKQFEEDTRRAFRQHGRQHFSLLPSLTSTSTLLPEPIARESSSSQFHNPNNRMLTSHHLPDSELSPKAKVSYDESKFQIELNVNGFKPEDLSIKTEGDVLIIHARHESKKETGGNFKSNEFEQRFSLPSGVKPELITSRLSETGLLTVTAPREHNQHHLVMNSANPISYSKPIITTGGSSNNHNSSPGSKIDVFNPGLPASNEEGLPQPKITYEDDKVTISLDCRKFRPEELDVKVDGSNIVVMAKQEIKESGGTRKRLFEQSFSMPSGVKPENIQSNLTKDGVLIISAARGNTSASISHQNIERHMDNVLSPSNWNRRESFPQETHDNDVKVLTDNDTYKIKVDVSSYKPEELVIKTLDNSVHIKAKHEEKTTDGRSSSVRQFSKSYTLPKGVNPESVVSSLSKEGILTVSAPLPTNKLNDSERLVPIKHS
ncbi:uncharacterized protein [Lepeophtheirus salmonis]|uniref:Heat shock protein beta6like [Nasonia vitripennis] n=2 Tax=Lepeophtheirus salmonis TaxID=72036 RepID=A0A0K2TQ68_LEPSM|nr:major egg antigen-like [Lepeophtheirus salmonis]